MPTRKLISLAVALVLLVCAYAPPVAGGARLTDGTPSAVAATDDSARDAAQPAAQPAAQSDTEAAAKPKRRGGIGRVLSAPFRALAKLFGGGGKDAKQAAAKKKKTDASAGVKAAAVTQPAHLAADAKKGEGTTKAAKKDESAAGGTAGRARAVAAQPSSSVSPAAPNPAETTRIVRPAEERLMPRPDVWVPVIEGIPKDPLSQGRALLHHGYVNEAVSVLSVAAVVGDNLVEANNLLGLAYDRLGWHRTAIEAYERALSVAPNDAVVLANLGYSHYLDSNYTESVKRLKQAARLSPSSDIIHNNLGVAQAAAGKFGDAFKSFARAGGEYDAHVKLAGILETARRDRDAAKHYEAALRLQPGTSALLERLVAIYERTGERTKADTARRTLGKPKNEQKTTTGGG